jgi:two-component system OmpR family sensor kinase
MIAAVLALVAIALMVISVAGFGFLRNYLIGQADSQLTSMSQQSGRIEFTVAQYLARGGHTEVSNGPYAIGWLPAGGKLRYVLREPVGYTSPSSSGSAARLKPGPVVTPGAAWLSGESLATVGATSGGGRYRMLALPGQTMPDSSGGLVNGTIVIGLDVSASYQTLARLTAVDLVVSGILLIGLAILGVAVIRASLRPLTDIEKTAEAIAAGDLSRRVPDLDPRTEIGRLGRSLNTMLAQVEAAFHARASSETAARRSEERMRQFVADASHELRTPLTAIRGFAEYYRQRGGVALPGPAGPGQAGQGQAGQGQAGPGGHGAGRPAGELPPAARNGNGNGHGQLAPADLDRIMRRVEQESSRMGILVEDMLLLARLDQQRPLENRTVDLLTLAADAVHDARVVAPDRAINLTVGAGAALLVLGDEVRLRQVIGNLMSNALSHTPAGTPVDVAIRSGTLAEARPAAPPAPGDGTAPGPVAARPAAVLEVTDHGPGISREQAEHVFERFYRADQARTTGGTGLGLAIVSSLVTAHDGVVWVDSAPGGGATFRIALPLAPEALHHDEHDEHDEEQDTP